MTLSEMQEMIGREAQYDVGEMSFTVVITDVRKRYGTTDYLITPQHKCGCGSQWVQETSVRFI